MNIKILDSWLRQYLKSSAKPEIIAKNLSLTSVSIERIEKLEKDYVYDIEVTTNRPDIMSVVGLAREAAAVLPQFEIDAKFLPPKFKNPPKAPELDIEIKNDPRLVNRICAVALSVKLGPSPIKIRQRLEASGIRSLNNVVDVTNYVMREIGHPMHVFDLDRLASKKLIIREAIKGEKLVTLDGKEFTLAGGDIVADDGTGQIVDLLGIMGVERSVVTDTTSRVLLFTDNNDPARIRKTSMGLALRTEAATLNEKGVDPELAMDALLAGVELLEEIADAKVISEVVDIYPNKPKSHSISILENKVNAVIGLKIPLKVSSQILESLGFKTKTIGSILKVDVPSWRINDVQIEEDLIEEIARVYGYLKLPSTLPAFETGEPYNLATDRFYWEQKVKNALKYFGFTEIYTYSMVSENLLEVAPSEAVTLKNPLTEDHVYMRTALVPSLLNATRENKNREELKLFELANVYVKHERKLPDEKLKLAGILKNPKANILEVKGIVEALMNDIGIENVEFKKTPSGAVGVGVYIGNDFLGEIEKLDADLIDFEFDFETILKHATLKKIYKPVSKFPESIEDLRFEIDEAVPYEKIVRTIKQQSGLIKKVELLDVYKNKKTFRIIYQSDERNLTGEDLEQARQKIISALKKSFRAEPA